MYRVQQAGKKYRFVPEKKLNIVSVLGSAEAPIIKIDNKGRAWLTRGKEFAIGTPLGNGEFKWDKNTLARFSDEITGALYPENNGVVWIGGLMGLVRYDSRQKVQHSQHVKTLIRLASSINTRDTLYGGWESIGKVQTLSPQQRALHFEFTTQSFEDSERNHFSTWLEGLEDNWSDWSREQIKEYTNLPPGTYHFHVKGKNAYGQEAEEAVYSFYLPATWYLSTWAYLLYILAGGSMVYGFVRWRTRHLKMRSVRLEQAVKERTNQLQERTAELSQRLEELATVNEVSKGLNSQLHLDELFKMRQLFKANIVYIAVHEKASNMIHFPYEYGDSMPSRKFVNGLTKKIIRSKEPILLNQESTQSNKTLNVDTLGQSSKSYLGVPIISGDEVLGVLSVQSTQQENRFKEDDLRLMNTIAANVGIAIHNAELFDEAQQALAQAEEAKVFEKFKQAGDTLTDKPKGTDLGLPICKEIVEHHGGQLWLESEVGKGSTFFFSLPVKTPGIQPLDLEKLMQQFREQVGATQTSQGNGPAEILVADDEPHIRNLLRQELSEASYKVLEAANGREAIEETRQKHPALIILDVMMPEINGFDAAAVLKMTPKPSISLSSYSPSCRIRNGAIAWE